MSESVLKKLVEFYQDEGPERVGYVSKDGELVELTNVAPEPEVGFDVSGADILIVLDHGVATWHTHPGGSRNLSVGDYETFLTWNRFDHYIIGKDGVRRYFTQDGDLISE